jgi:hypothetical protein
MDHLENDVSLTVSNKYIKRQQYKDNFDRIKAIWTPQEVSSNNIYIFFYYCQGIFE